MKRILFVDDEPNVLQGLRRMLRPMRKEWEMSFAESAHRAIDLINADPFDVVVTDMRMPEMDGAQLLNEVMRSDPNIARIVLSGHTDQEAALRSAGTAHQFLAKPCDAEALRNAVQRACQLRALLSDSNLIATATGLGALPSAPEVFGELTQEMNSEDASIRRIGEIIGKDMAMSAKVLQLVNSAFFGLPRTVESVEEAVTFLGTDVIRGLVLSNAAFESFDAECEGFHIDSLWQHSLAVGALARDVAALEDCSKATVDEAMIAGLLHDVGQLLLAATMPDGYSETMRTAAEKRIPLHQAERAALGCSHGEIGAYLMGLWGLPDGVIEAIAYHDKPGFCPTTQMTPLVAVHVANACAHFAAKGEDALEAALDIDLIRKIGCEERIEEWRGLSGQRHSRDDAA